LIGKTDVVPVGYGRRFIVGDLYLPYKMPKVARQGSPRKPIARGEWGS
jgi:hypothetical protein